MHTGFLWGNLKERDTLEGVGIDGRTILKWMSKEIEWEGVGWVHLAWDNDKC
jgi:hypothetical protein